MQKPERHHPADPEASPAHWNIPDVAESTKRFYEKTIRSLHRDSTKKRSFDILEPVSVSPQDMVEDLFKRTDIGPKTFQIYKTAMIWYLRNKISDPYCAKAYETLRRREAERKNQVGSTGKRRKARVIPESDYSALVEQLNASGNRSKWSKRAKVFLMAVLATGVRPAEWPSAEWVDPEEKTTLRVVSAKRKVSAPAFMRKADFVQTEDGGVYLHNIAEEQTYGVTPEVERSMVMDCSFLPDDGDDDFYEEYEETREIPVDKNDRLAVDAHMESIREHLEAGGGYFHYYSSCRLAVYRACNKIWNGRKLYSLYTMRSQFSANKKATVGSTKTAALMGHSSPDSPSTGYYGKANQAHSVFRTGPKPENDTLNQRFAPQKQAQRPRQTPKL